MNEQIRQKAMQFVKDHGCCCCPEHLAAFAESLLSGGADLHIESLRETLELAHGSIISFRIGALLDVWDQLPNDILDLEELDAVRKKIAELRKGMEITK